MRLHGQTRIGEDEPRGRLQTVGLPWFMTVPSRMAEERAYLLALAEQVSRARGRSALAFSFR
jgi:hypothetical protein